MLDTFASIEIRRVKIGVGRPPGDTGAIEYVLTPMGSERLAIMRKAYVEAAHRALTLLAVPESPHTELLDVRARFEREYLDQDSSADSGEQTPTAT